MGSRSARVRHSVLVMFSALAFTAPATAAAGAGPAGCAPWGTGVIGVVAGAPIALQPDELGGTYVTDFGRRQRN
jgi:hypothetical protein